MGKPWGADHSLALTECATQCRSLAAKPGWGQNTEMKMSRWRVGLLFALGWVTSCANLSDGPAEADPGRYSAADEKEYLERFRQLAEARYAGAGLNAYDPLEPVPGAPQPLPLPRARTNTIAPEALNRAAVYAGNANSSAFIVWRKGFIEAEHYFGDADRNTLLVSRSLAKPITVLAVGRAIQLGYITSLDQSVADFVTEWRGTKKAAIRIRYLLDMRTGLLPQALATTPEDILNRAYLHPRHDEVIVHDYPLTHEPGSRYEYSNANSELVALVIERATGQRYGHWVSEQILEPLNAPGGQVWVNRPGGLAHAGCCILLPAESWLRMAILLLKDGVWDGQRLLPEGYVDEMRTPTPQNEHAGMGLYVAGRYVERRGAANPEVLIGRNYHSEPYLAEDLFLFDGNANQVVYVVPSEQLVILRMGVRPPNEPEWDNAYLPNTLISAIRLEPGSVPLVPQSR